MNMQKAERRFSLTGCLRRSLILWVGLSLTACATVTPERGFNENAQVVDVGEWITVVPVYANKDDQPFAQSLRLALDVQPMMLGGRHAGRLVVSEESYIGMLETLQLDELEALAHSRATHLLPIFDTIGLELVPKTARFSAVSVTELAFDSDDELGRGMFFANNGNDWFPLVLIYFSEAATLTGTSEYGGIETEYRIHADKPGFVWAEIFSLSETQELVTNRRSPKNDAVVIWPIVSS